MEPMKPAGLRSVTYDDETYISIQDLLMWFRYAGQHVRDHEPGLSGPVAEVIDKLGDTLLDRWLKSGGIQ